MFHNFKGFSLFISVERGFMLFMISIGATILIAGNIDWSQVIHLGFIVFCGWSGLDAINNICDVDLDRKSDPVRAEYTEKIGGLGVGVSFLFLSSSVGLGMVTGVPLVTLFVLLGIFIGVLYSVPPFRVRQTVYKPLVNSAVGAVPILVVSAFYNVFTFETYSLTLLIGVTTAVNSLWEDLADYASDLESRSKTFLIVLGFKWGVYVTIILGYCLVPLMVLVGIMFKLGLIYYIVLTGLVAYMSLRIVQNQSVLFRGNTKLMLELGQIFARDFVIMAIVQTTNLMLSSYLKYGLIFL